uniref:hypothetical protein n=1 Tax=Paraburkholderia saeva TaxID=2777537 RepID=UPI002B4B9730|nr:hypothetical protein [Paraburkholderia saeva]
MNTAPFAKRVMGDRVFTLILRQCRFIRKEAKRFRTKLDMPESQLATQTAIAFECAVVEINPGFKSHPLAMATTLVCTQHRALSPVYGYARHGF